MPGPETSAIENGALCPVTVAASVARAAALAPTVTALVAPDGRQNFAELADRVVDLRKALVQLGVNRGDHVGLCLGNSVVFHNLFLALATLGAVVVPVNTRLRADEIGYAIRQSKVRVLFTADQLLSSDFLSMLRQIIPGIDTALPDPHFPDLQKIVVIGDTCPTAAIAWDDFLTAGIPVADPGPQSDPTDVVLIQYTSGSTGFPKGVMLRQCGMLTNGFVSGQRMGLRTGDRFHSARPFFHVAGTSLSILAALQNVATLVTMTRFEPTEALALMEQEACTHFSGNDTMALMLLNHPDRAKRKLSLRGAWVAGSTTVLRRVVEELGARECVSGYGLSEASPNVAQSCWWEPVEVRTSGKMRPQPGLDVRVINPATGLAETAGIAGEIQVRGWSVMRGYFDMPDKTIEVLAEDGWLSTGDLGRFDADGRLEFVGRLKNIVRVGGENVSPEEVENVLNRHPAIRLSQVVGVPDERLQEVCAAFVIPNDGMKIDPEEVMAWAREVMASFKVPRYVWAVDGFEDIGMTASSKVQKSKLAEHARRLLDKVVA